MSDLSELLEQVGEQVQQNRAERDAKIAAGVVDASRGDLSGFTTESGTDENGELREQTIFHRAKRNVNLAAGMNSEAVGAAVRASIETGFPVNTTMQWDNQRKKHPDVSSLAPETQEFLGEDLTHAAISKDDVENIDALVQTAKYAMSPLAQRRQQMQDNLKAEGYSAAQLADLAASGIRPEDGDPTGKKGVFHYDVGGEDRTTEWPMLEKWYENPVEQEFIDNQRKAADELVSGQYDDKRGSAWLLMASPEEQANYIRQLDKEIAVMKALSGFYGDAWTDFSDEELQHAINTVGNETGVDVTDVSVKRLRPEGVGWQTDWAETFNFFGVQDFWKRMTGPSKEELNLIHKDPLFAGWSVMDRLDLIDELEKQAMDLRGKTLANNITEGTLSSVKFGLELWAGGIGQAYETATSEMLGHGIIHAVKTAPRAFWGLMKAAAGIAPGRSITAVDTALEKVGGQISATIQDGEVVPEYDVGEVGDLAKEIVNAFLDQYIEDVSEGVGEMLPPVAILGRAVPKKLQRAAFVKAAKETLQRYAGKQGVKQVLDIMQKMGWHGIPAEWFEEIMGDVMRYGVTGAAEVLGTSIGDLGQNTVFNGWDAEAERLLQIAVTGTVIPAVAYGASETVNALNRMSGAHNAKQFQAAVSTLKERVDAASTTNKRSPEIMEYLLRKTMGTSGFAYLTPEMAGTYFQSMPDTMRAIGVTEEIIGRATTEERLVPVSVPALLVRGSAEEVNQVLEGLIPDPKNMLTPGDADKVLPSEMDDALNGAQAALEDKAAAIQEVMNQLVAAKRPMTEIKATLRLLQASDYFAAHNTEGMTAAEWIRGINIILTNEPDFMARFVKPSVEVVMNLKGKMEQAETDARTAEAEADRLEAEATATGTDDAKKAAETARRNANVLRGMAIRATNDWASAAEKTPEYQAAQAFNDAIADAAKQEIGSGETSLDQVAAGFKKIDFKPGTVNLDLGGGKFDKGTEYLAGKGVTNLVYDPVNRSAESNQAIFDAVKNGGVDTVTCNNVLNVIKEEGARSNVILQAAKALKPGGVAYFTVYEGDGSGNGHETSKGWQEHRKTADYMDEIKQHFGDVVRHGKIIEARNPQTEGKTSAWFNEGFGGAPALFQVSPVWTGSAAEYSQPSLQYVGSGEGAQVYGYGLYGSRSRRVAEWYAREDFKRKSRPNGVKFRGKEVVGPLGLYEAFEHIEEKEDATMHRQALMRIKMYAEQAPEYSLADIIELVKENPVTRWGGESFQEKWEKVVDEVSQDVELVPGSSAGRNLYKQTFWPDKEEDLLNWDHFVSEEQAEKVARGIFDQMEEEDIKRFTVQMAGIGSNSPMNPLYDLSVSTDPVAEDGSQRIFLTRGTGNGHSITISSDGTILRNAWDDSLTGQHLSALVGESAANYILEHRNDEPYQSFVYHPSQQDYVEVMVSELSALTGQELYEELEDFFGTPKEASEFLYKAGIDGVTYIGDSSGVRNYVAFSDKDIRVDEHIRFQSAMLRAAFLNSADVEIRQAFPEKSGANAKDVLKSLAGKNIVNRDNNTPAQINHRQAGKLVSNASVEKSKANGFTREDHMDAVANIEALYENAILVQEREDTKNGEPEVIIRRFVAPIVIRGMVADALLTQKQSLDKDGSTRVYSLELEELVNAEEGYGGARPDRGASDGTHRLTREDCFPDGWNKLQQKHEKVKRFLEENGGFLRNQGEHRGAITFNEDWKATIALFEGAADGSTVIHETGHYIFDMMQHFVEAGLADDRMKSDYEKLRAWATISPEQAAKGYEAYLKGVPEGELPLTMEQWKEIEEQERLARGFEAYCMEGRAPSVELQGAFATLRRILLHIYKTVRALGVTLSDDVRKVFDGMLATETTLVRDSILLEAADQIDRELLGLSQAEVKTFRELIQKSNEQAVEAMTAEKNAKLKELRKQWRKEAQELMDGDPVYNVWFAIQKEGRMDYVALEEIAGEYIAQRLRAMGLATNPGRKSKAKLDKDGNVVRPAGYYSAKSGKHPATMAAQAGFDSVEEMIDQLLASKSPQDFTAEYMADEERKFNAEFEMSEKAQSVQASIEALEKLSEMLAVKGGQIGYRFRRALLKQQAIAELNSMSIAHIVSDKKLIADCRMNARALTKAANEGDFKGAFEHAKALRFNLEVLRMKGDAKKVVDDTIGLLRKGRHAKKGTIYGDHQEALMDLSFRFGFTNNLPKIQHDVASVVREFNEEAAANGDMPLDVPDWMLNFSMDYRKMTFGQFQELKNLAEFLYGEGKELVSAREETFRNSVKAAVEGTVAELKDQKHKYTRSTNFVVKGWRGMVNWGTKLRNIVGMATDWNPDSTLQKLYDEMAFAESEQTQVMAEPMRQCTAALDALYKATRGLNLEAIADIPFPQDVKAEGYRQWDAEKVVAACLNMGTLKNKQRLIDGYEWGEKGDEYASRIASLLTAEDWASIQAIWDAMAQLTPRTAQTFKEEYHYDLKLEEAAPFTVNTKDGQEIDVRGGYYPLEYLYHKNTVVNDKVDALKNAPKFRRASFTFERNEQVTDPLALSLNTVFNHIFDASHYISHRHVMRKVLRVINDRAFRSHFQQTQGFERYAALKALIENVAAPGAALKGMTSEFENWGRAVVTASALWASPSVVAMQLSSITYGIDELGGYYLEAASENMAHPVDTFKFVMAHSGMMRDRVNLKDLDLKMRANEFRQNQAQHIRSVVTQIGYSPMRFVDLAVAIPAWKAAYDKALDEGKSDSHAVASADEFVAKTQGATRAIDLSPLQLKPWGRGLTVFFSAVSAGSTMGTKTISKVFGGKMSAGEAAYSATMNLVLPLLFSCLIRYAVSGAGGGDPDKARRAFLRELMTNPFQGVPVLRDVADFAAGRVLNPSGKTQRTVFENTSLRGASDLVVTAFDGVEAAFEENPDRAMYKLADAVGTLFQVPVVRVYERLRQMLVDWTGDEKILPDIDEETKHKKSNKKRRRH